MTYSAEIERIGRALNAASYAQSYRHLRRRRRALVSALLVATLLLASVGSAIGGIGPLSGLTRAKAVSVVDRVDTLNEAIRSCMVAHGASVQSDGTGYGFIDPENKAQRACAPDLQAEANYVRSPAYAAFEADQAGRGQPYADCMNAAGYTVPGWNGADGNAEQAPSTQDRTAASDHCSDAVGLVRRGADGTGTATPGSP